MSKKQSKDSDAGVKGWRKEIKVRQKGITRGRVDVYMYSPENVKFRSRKELEAFLKKTKSKIRIEDFNFYTPPATSSASKSSATKKLSVKNDVQAVNADRKTASNSSKSSATKKLSVKNDVQAVNGDRKNSSGNAPGTSSLPIPSAPGAAASGDAPMNNASTTDGPSTSGVKVGVKSLRNSVRSVKTAKPSLLPSPTESSDKSSAKSSVRSSTKKIATAALKPNLKPANKGRELPFVTRKAAMKNVK